MQAIQEKIGTNEVGISKAARWLDLQRLGVLIDGFVELAQAVINDTKVIGRNVVARIGLRPEIVGLASLL